MRLPQRVRGLVLGLTTLVVGPVLAATAVAPASAIHRTAVATPSATPIDAVLTGNHLHPRIPELADRQTPEPTPAPTPVPTPVPTARPVVAAPPAVQVAAINYPPGSVDAIIVAAAKKWGVDGAWMIRIASCESGERPNAVSSNGLYYGLFQFLPSTFRAHGGTNIYDAAQQSDITANMLAHGGSNSWPVCSHR